MTQTPSPLTHSATASETADTPEKQMIRAPFALPPSPAERRGPNDVIRRRGLLLVMSSPSGAGKTTISQHLLEHDLLISPSISATTRPPRPGEEHGRDYFFITEDEFRSMLENGALIEHARVFDHWYGIPKAPVEAMLAAGRDVLFVIDWQGAQTLAEVARDDVVSVFILPPTIEELERRLRGRGQDSDETIARRMDKAAAEISHWPEYHYVIVNNDLDDSIRQVHTILEAERHKRTRQVGLTEYVRTLIGKL